MKQRDDDLGFAKGCLNALPFVLPLWAMTCLGLITLAFSSKTHNYGPLYAVVVIGLVVILLTLACLLRWAGMSRTQK